METINPTQNSQTNLPNASAVLTLGILSIVLCWCHGIIGIIMAIVALVLANRDLGLYASDPEKYTTNSYKNITTGRTVAIVGLVLAGLFLSMLIISVLFLGLNFALVPWDMIEEFNH